MKDSLVLTKTILLGMIGAIMIEEGNYDYENEPRWTYLSNRVKGEAKSLIEDIEQLLIELEVS